MKNAVQSGTIEATFATDCASFIRATCFFLQYGGEPYMTPLS